MQISAANGMRPLSEGKWQTMNYKRQPTSWRVWRT